MISSDTLPQVRRAIRAFLTIPDTEPVDLVAIASYLVSHVQSRECNLWMVIVGAPDSGKTELIKLLARCPTAWRFSDRPTAGFLLSAQSEENSVVFQMERRGIRVVLVEDMAMIYQGVTRQYRDAIHAQLLNFHDGHLVLQTGLKQAKRIEWGPKSWPETIGWLGAATEDFYRSQRFYSRIGDRFLTYHYNKASALHWSDHSELKTILDGIDIRAPRRREAQTIVTDFVAAVLRDLAETDDYARIVVPDAFNERAAAAARLVGRILGSGRSQGTGTRRAIAIREVVKMIAYLHGRTMVLPSDMDIGMQIMLSQIPPEEYNVVMFASQPAQLGRNWKPLELFARMGGSRVVYRESLEQLVDAGIIDKEAKRVGSYEQWSLTLSPDVINVASVFDPDRRIFRFKDAPPPEPPPPQLADGSDLGDDIDLPMM